MAKANVSIYNVSADEPGGTDVIVQLVGAEALAESSAVSAQQASNNVSVTLTGAVAVAEAGTLPSQAKKYPLVGCSLIGGSQPWATNHPDASYQLDGIGKLDFVMLNAQPAKIPAITDGTTFRSIQNIVKEMKNRNPDLQIFLYTNTHETRNTSGLQADKCYAENGPAGAELFWDTQSAGKFGSNILDSGGTDLTPIGPFASTGLSVNDWWVRDPDGFKRSTFGSPPNIPYNVNIAPPFVQPDSNGDIYPQWYFANIVVPDLLDPHLISNGGIGFGLTGVNIFADVTDDAPRTNSADLNGDGQSDQARSIWDAFNSSHVNDPETVIGGGVHSAAGYRKGHRVYHDTIKAYDPDIQVLHNSVTWSRQTQNTGATAGIDVQPEYQLVQGDSIPLVSTTPRQSMTEGFFSESQTKNTGFPVTGVGADGLLNGLSFPGVTNGWWIAYNQYRFISEISTGGNYSGTSGSIECKTRLTPDLNGEAQWDWIPDPNSVFHLMRWLLCMALLDDGYFVTSGIQVGTTRTGSSAGAVIFDEYGTINEATTGLTKGYLGQPLEGKVHIPFVGTTDHGVMTRLYEGGRVFATTSKTNIINVPVTAQGWLGLYDRINGVQDPAWNDGNPLVDFNMPPIDGLIAVNA